MFARRTLALGVLLFLCATHLPSDRARPTSGPLPSAATSDDNQRDLELNLRWMLAHERRGEQTPARVGVYADAGVWHLGARSIVEALESVGVSCRILDRSLLRAEVLNGLEAVVLPGGWAPLEWASAGADGLAALRTYVERGGRCVGVCAGAYLLAREVRYDGKSYPYPLGLFDGAAAGPVAGLAPYPQAGAARLTPTPAGERRGLGARDGQTLYYSGGPCFVGGTEVEVLARYDDGSAAVVQRPVGAGEVVLIGAHAEVPAVAARGEPAASSTVAAAWYKALCLPDARR